VSTINNVSLSFSYTYFSPRRGYRRPGVLSHTQNKIWGEKFVWDTPCLELPEMKRKLIRGLSRESSVCRPGSEDPLRFTTVCSARQKGRGQHVAIKGEMRKRGFLQIRAVIVRHGSCSHWSEKVYRFYRTETGLQYIYTAVQMIQA
jgi:hypothetical protein